ncbi:hypothetical protein LCGC14_0930790 [marine sediment metagenome]|uniref:Uncharacterized protein n=1 Tax=marine sediment metagenome TaxID=412755 RepID=A0A0F9NN28_9ZZZZ|nr:hypothetical protein [archaeon]
MPEDIDELKKFENLSEMETKVVKFLKENIGKAYDSTELVELVYDWDREQGGSIKNYLSIIGGSISLTIILGNLVEKKRINKIIAKGKVFYYLE